MGFPMAEPAHMMVEASLQGPIWVVLLANPGHPGRACIPGPWAAGVEGLAGAHQPSGIACCPLGSAKGSAGAGHSLW